MKWHQETLAIFSSFVLLTVSAQAQAQQGESFRNVIIDDDLGLDEGASSSKANASKPQKNTSAQGNNKKITLAAQDQKSSQESSKEESTETSQEQGGDTDAQEASKKQDLKKSSTSQKSSSKKKKQNQRRKQKKESISEVAQLQMDIADLIKKVNKLEKEEKSKNSVEKLQDSVEEIQKDLDKKVFANNKKVKVTVGGHVNRAALYIDNGTNSRLKHVDNDNSPSRFSFRGEGKVNDCFTMGGYLELAVAMNSSSDVDVNNTQNATSNPISTRVAEFYFQHDQWGKLFAGQGPMVSDDTAEQDLSGTYVATQASGVQGPAGGTTFIDKSTNLSSGIHVKSAWTQMDGLGRETRVRYDTPQIFGLVLGASHSSSDSWDVAAKFKGEAKGYHMAAAVAYASEHDANKSGFTQFDGSVSLLTPIGFNATFAGGNRNFKAVGRKTARYWLARLGFKTNPFEVGDLALGVDYGRETDLVNAGDGSYGNGGALTTYGLALVQNIDKISTEAYCTIRTYKLSGLPRTRTGAFGKPLFKDIWVAMVGARVKL